MLNLGFRSITLAVVRKVNPDRGNARDSEV
jgi:hypothetical protein